MPLYELTVSGRLIYVTADTDAGAVSMARETLEDAYRNVSDAEALDGPVLMIPSGGGPRLIDETLCEALKPREGAFRDQ